MVSAENGTGTPVSAQPGAQSGGDSPGAHPALKLLGSLVLDVGAPIGIYYGLHGAGVSDLWALIAGSVPPVVSNLWSLVRRGKVDRLGLFVVVMLALSVVLSLTTDNPRLLLLRDGWLTGAAGVAFLLTVGGRQPLALTFSRPLLERSFIDRSGPWDKIWDGDHDFRRIWRVSTLLWGAGLILDAVVRTIMAYALPVDVVPALNGVQYGVSSVLMLLIVNIQQSRMGLWWILSGRPEDEDKEG